MTNTIHRKVALIIGNDDYYREENKLTESVKNAKDLSNLLQTINFNEIKTYTNIKRDDKMNIILRKFVNTIEDGDLILFYFSGHGYRIENKDYLIPIDDKYIQNDQDIIDFSINVEHLFELLIKKNKSFVTIFILDCSIPYHWQNQSTSNGSMKGLTEIDGRNSSLGASIQFICSNQEQGDGENANSNHLFNKYLLDNIITENETIIDIFKRIEDLVYRESNRMVRPLIINQLQQHQEIYLNQVITVVQNIPPNARWESKGVTIIGGTINNLRGPQGIYVTDNQTIFVADTGHDRLMKYTDDATRAKRISGKKVGENEYDRLYRPSTMIQDIKSNNLIICDRGNHRVLRWNKKTGTYTQIIKENMACFDLAMDDGGCLYVSDIKKHEVRRYEPGGKHGIIVAGGHGAGHRLSQLNQPTYIFVDAKQSVYISDSLNNRVVKWEKDAKKGIIVAGGHGNTKATNQLYHPTGLIVDRLGTIYIADHWNNRIMRWQQGKEYGEIIAGDKYLAGNGSHELNGPEGIAFDHDGNLYVADSYNNRIQRFNIQIK